MEFPAEVRIESAVNAQGLGAEAVDLACLNSNPGSATYLSCDLTSLSTCLSLLVDL